MGGGWFVSAIAASVEIDFLVTARGKLKSKAHLPESFDSVVNDIRELHRRCGHAMAIQNCCHKNMIR
jgi:hypothetical protein